MRNPKASKISSFNIPIEILTRAHSNQSITIRQRREDTDPIVPISPILPLPSNPQFFLLPCCTNPIAGQKRNEGQIFYSLIRILKLRSYRHDFLSSIKSPRKNFSLPEIKWEMFV
jgi:hypothetical protein